MFNPNPTLLSRSRSFTAVALLASCAVALAQAPKRPCSGYQADYELPNCKNLATHTSAFGIEVRAQQGFTGKPQTACKVANCCKNAKTIPGDTVDVCTTLPGGDVTLNATLQGSITTGYTWTVGGAGASFSETDQEAHQISGSLAQRWPNDAPREVKCPDVPACWIKGKQWVMVNCKVTNTFKFVHCYGGVEGFSGNWKSAIAIGSFDVTTHKCFVGNITKKCTNKECK